MDIYSVTVAGDNTEHRFINIENVRQFVRYNKNTKIVHRTKISPNVTVFQTIRLPEQDETLEINWNDMDWNAV